MRSRSNRAQLSFNNSRRKASRRRAPIQELLDAHTTGEMNDFDKHLRAWSYFDVMLRDDRERFVKFLAALRNNKPARQAMRSEMKCEPEDFDRRWADVMLNRRPSAAPTAAELSVW